MTRDQDPQRAMDLLRLWELRGITSPTVAAAVDAVAREANEALAADTPEDRRHEAGDVMMTAAMLAIRLDQDPLEVLAEAVERYVARSRRVVELAGGEEALDNLPWADKVRLWRQAKAELAVMEPEGQTLQQEADHG